MHTYIQLLPDSVANQIAAGEVVQRPASVVKELLENAVDAGADEIRLTVKDAGKTLIQVSDNGCGMNEADARMCFERHATSKIKTAEDIFNVLTMGFRGEAMASIASVCQVVLKTRDSESETGTEIKVAGSQVEYQRPVSWKQGSCISVKNIFYNTPARRQFLKSDQVELKHIIEAFYHMALSHPEIECSMEHNGNTLYKCPRANQRQRIVQLLGAHYNERLVPTEEQTDLFRLTGFVCKPQFARKTRGEQYLFVNRRFIKSRYLHHAISTAYRDLIEDKEHPSYFLFYDIPPDTIDVNIHPTKTEIRFRDEQVLYRLTESTIRKALGMHNVTPSLDFDALTNLEITPARGNRPVAIPEVKVDPGYNPFDSAKRPASAPPSRPGNEEKRIWSDMQHIQQEFAIDPEKEMSATTGESSQADDVDPEPPTTGHPFMQVLDRYILTRIKSGFVLIDQHRAHQRVLYEQLLEQMAHNRSHSQTVLFADKVDLNPAELALLEPQLPLLREMGFTVESFGGNTLVFQGVPEGLYIESIRAFVESFLDNLEHASAKTTRSGKEMIAAQVARSSSIPYGRKLNMAEMRSLSDRLFASSAPNHCPVGKPTIVTFTANDLSNLFR